MPRPRVGAAALKTALIVSAVGTLTLVLRGPAARWVVAPLLGLWQVVEALPQVVVWVVLVLMGLLVTWALGCRSSLAHEKPPPAPPSLPSECDLDRLAKVIRWARTSRWAREVLGERVSSSAAVLLAWRRGMPLDAARDEVRAGRWQGASSVGAVLRPVQPRARGKSEDYGHALAQALASLERLCQGEEP